MRWSAKYPVEFFLEFRSVDRFLYRISDLYKLGEVTSAEVLARLDNCHIYLLGKRPRISITPGSVRVGARRVRFKVEYRTGTMMHCSDVELPRSIFKGEELRFEASLYPHRELVTYAADGELLGYMLLANLVHLIPTIPQKAKDLEVVYVGKGLRRSAQDRLANHSTLQRILAEVNSNEPDTEVFCLVYSFEYKKNALALTGCSSEILGRAATEHYNAVLNYRPSLDEQVELIEASIISYFRPAEYNKQYLDFPRREHKILSRLYDADVAAIMVQLDNSSIGELRIFSPTAQPGSIHDIIVDFRQLKGRPSLFGLSKRTPR